MIARIALRNLMRHRLRTTVTILGLSIAVALLTDMLMLSSGMEESLRTILRTLQYEIRICPPGTLPFSSEAELSGSSQTAAVVRAVPGVDRTLRVLGASLFLAAGEETRAPVFVIGIEGRDQCLFRMIDGEAPEIEVPPDTTAMSGVAVNETLARELHAGVGDTVVLTHHAAASMFDAQVTMRCRIVGIASFHFDLPGQRSLAMPLQTLQRFLGRDNDPASFILAKLQEPSDGHALFASGATQARVAGRLRALLPNTSVYSIEEFMDRLLANLAYFRQFALILGSISVLVTFLLVGVVLIIGVNEQRGEVAAMRSIGFRRSTLHLIVLAESAMLILASVAVGLMIGIALSGYLDRLLTASPGIPPSFAFFVPNALAIAKAIGIAGLTGLAAALYPAFHTTRIDIVKTMHEEAI